LPVEARWRTRLSALVSFAKHPLVLIAAGAIVSGLLVPALTRGAQNHQKGLEIKSDLVRSMSAAASPFLAATLANELAYNGNVPRSYDLAYQQWLTRSSEIQAQLQTYFPDLPSIPKAVWGGTWQAYSLRMRDLYYFFRLSRGKGRYSGARTEYVRRLEGFLGERQKLGCGDCTFVDFRAIDLWLATRSRGFDDLVNLSFEEMMNAFKTALYDLEATVLKASPRL
jgi:hypothetical protein